MPDKPETALDLAEPEVAETRNVRIEIEPPDSYVYSNVAALSISPWDFRIHFADVTPTENENAKFKAVVGIVMPPEHAAGLMFLLKDQLSKFEQVGGPIRHPRWQAMVDNTRRRLAREQDSNTPDKS